MKFLGITVVILACMHASVFGADSTKSVLFISDTQQPLWIETLRLHETDNEGATKKIFSAIQQESSATALFHLGDFSSIGMVGAYWRSFDVFQRSLHIPIFPVLGNHDYYVFPFLAMAQFRQRFPNVSPSWYATQIDGLVVIALNSNFSHLSDKELQTQRSWYCERLSSYDRDSTVKAVIVVCHHPPYTNSDIIDPSTEVQNTFVKPFMKIGRAHV